jgi:hypothetical protein
VSLLLLEEEVRPDEDVVAAVSIFILSMCVIFANISK